MRVLIVGGTGLISVGIVRHLLARGADVTMFNRGKSENRLPPSVRAITGDRNDFTAFENRFANEKFDVVIDMICFKAEQAQSAVRAFAGRCEQFIFCSTVCTYGVKVPRDVLIDETFPQEPISTYGKNKVECERIFRKAHAEKKFQVTMIRPSHTYGPGFPLICNLEFNTVAWDRVSRNQPVLCAGDGLGLWQSTHRDDCGKLFAHAALNPKTYGQDYNATRDAILTWREYYRQVAAALGTTAHMIFMPVEWIVKHDRSRFGLLAEITQYHGAYTSEKAKRDISEFRCEIDLITGAKETLDDMKRRNAWRSGADDAIYNKMIEQARSMGVDAVAV